MTGPEVLVRSGTAAGGTGIYSVIRSPCPGRTERKAPDGQKPRSGAFFVPLRRSPASSANTTPEGSSSSGGTCVAAALNCEKENAAADGRQLGPGMVRILRDGTLPLARDAQLPVLPSRLCLQPTPVRREPCPTCPAPPMHPVAPDEPDLEAVVDSLPSAVSSAPRVRAGIARTRTNRFPARNRDVSGTGPCSTPRC